MYSKNVIHVAAFTLLLVSFFFSCQPVEEPSPKASLLGGNIKELPGTLVVEGEKVAVTWHGQVAFDVVQNKEELIVSFSRFNLLCDGVKTPRGESGQISLTLDKKSTETKYDSKTGQIESRLTLNLHYPLIDKLKGYRTVKEEEQQHVFPSYIEKMSGTFAGAFSEPLDPQSDKGITLKGEFELNLVKESLQLGYISTLQAAFIWEELVRWILKSTEVLTLQPVFVGTGPDDPDASGVAYPELLARCKDMWSRCGTERCIGIVSKPPIYIDDDDYKVIDSSSEAASFRSEVDESDAIEIFVASELSSSLNSTWGGGATWGGGNAASQIVTSDQQLDVPCPAPCSGGGSCGDVNYYHLAHEVGHVLYLDHPSGVYGLAESSATSVMEPSGFCADNPNKQSAKNCRNATNPLLYWSLGLCTGEPDIDD